MQLCALGKAPCGINTAEDLGKVSRLVRDAKAFRVHREITHFHFLIIIKMQIHHH